MGAFDDPPRQADATSARTRARRAKESAEREEGAVTARNVLDLEQLAVDLQSRIAVLEHWQATAQGQNGISIVGNVFTGPRVPPPYEPPLPSEPVNPYELGTTAEGSDEPQNPTAPPALSSPMTDTGITGLQPLDIASVNTDGYKMQVMTRMKNSAPSSGVLDTLFFARDLIWMDDGRVYEATEETCIGLSTASGTGSGGGTV